MAYLKELVRKCYRCKKKALVAVMSNRNEHIGDYCREHGAQVLKEEEKAEQMRG